MPDSSEITCNRIEDFLAFELRVLELNWRSWKLDTRYRPSGTPPARREDPSGVGVEEPPDEDRRSDDEQAEGLIAAKEAALLGAALIFGELFGVRLDAAFDHGLVHSEGQSPLASLP